jgi:hypothetical protein
MRAHIVLDNEVINIIEVESLTSFTPEIGEIVDLPESVAIGYFNYDGVWKMKREYIEPQLIEYRNKLLGESDIVFLPDNYSKLSEEKKVEWVEYRQALRDLPAQEGFPWEYTLPKKPV